ncbi:MAG: DUF996 domain-containing protein [Brevinematales bacterium]
MKSHTKILLAVASLLMLLSVFPGVMWVGIGGLVLFLVGMHQLSQEKSDAHLFHGALWAFLVSVIGGIILGIFGGVVGIVGMGALWRTSAMRMGGRGMESLFSCFATENDMVLLLLLLVFVLAFWAIAVLYGIWMQKVSLSLESHLGNASFRTAGLLFFWGGWLAIVGVGIVLGWVAWLLYTIAFFSLPAE